MDRIKASKKINHLTGGDPNDMFCYRVHIQRRIYGGFWIPLAYSIDIVFYVLRRQKQHVRQTYLLQRRQHGTTKNKSQQGSDQEKKNET